VPKSFIIAGVDKYPSEPLKEFFYYGVKVQQFFHPNIKFDIFSTQTLCRWKTDQYQN